MCNKMLQAMYHVRKDLAIQFYNLNPEKSLFEESSIYALAKDCFPIFSSRNKEFEEFNDIFQVKMDFVEKVWNYISNESDENRYHTYYELEAQFGGKTCRFELMTTLRYAFLAGQLDDDMFWEKLVENAGSPIEAQHLNRPFDLSELFLLKY